MTLPCFHREQVVAEVGPTITLLSELDVLHPEILLQHQIEPLDYKQGLVFRSAIESIRGSFIASSTTKREALVRDVLENLSQREKIVTYKQKSGRERFDFEIQLEQAPDFFAALEVKGGEGNSINISERPLWAKEFYIWSHLDGAIVNQPAHGAHAIINRITNELVNRGKLVDAIFFKDMLCGTRTRPCPKYPGREATVGFSAAPDVFLFPTRVPTLDDPEPPADTLNDLKLPSLVFDLFKVQPGDLGKHTWTVQVKAVKSNSGKPAREVQVWHQGDLVSKSRSRLR